MIPRNVAGSGLLPCAHLLGGNLFGYATTCSETQALLDTAESLGVTAVDTADVYSAGESELQIGRCLRGRRERWFIASKAGVNSDGDGRGVGRREVLFERVEGSLRRLRTDYLDLYQLHRPDLDTPVEETVTALADLRRAGKIKAWGVSNFSAPHMAAMAARTRSHPQSNQIHFNLLSRGWYQQLSAGDQLEQSPVIAYGVLGRGVLSGKYHSGRAPAGDSRAARSRNVKQDLRPEVFALVEDLAHVAADAQISLGRLCVDYVLRQPGVAGAIIGVRTVEQLRSLVLPLVTALETPHWDAVEYLVRSAAVPESVTLGAPVTLLESTP